MAGKKKSVLEGLVAEAIRLDVDTLEIEHKDRYEEVFARSGSLGVGIARFQSESPEAVLLRKELYAMGRRRHRMTIHDREYELRVRIHHSFGEDAFCVELRPAW